MTARSAVLDALERLDQLLARSVAIAEKVHGTAPGEDPHRGLYVSHADAGRLLGRAPGAPLFGLAGPDREGPLSDVRRAYGLSRLDLDLALIALAPEVDLKYERIYAFLQDDITRRRPSIDLGLDLLCRSAEAKLLGRARFAPDAPLIVRRVLMAVPCGDLDDRPFLAQPMVMDPQMVRVFLGLPGGDPRVADISELLIPSAGPADARERAIARLAAETPREPPALVVSLEGPPRAGKRRAALALAHAQGMRLLVIDLARASADADLDAILPLALADARLRGAVPYVRGLERLPEGGGALARTLRRAGGVVVLAGSERPAWLGPSAVSVALRPLPYDARLAEWRRTAAAIGAEICPGELETLAARFRFSRGQIDDAAAHAQAHCRWRSAMSTRPARPRASDLFAGARAGSAPRLGKLAVKLEPRSAWRDIVLPDEQIGQLREILAEASHRHVVLGDWGFGRRLSLGKGLNILFSGPPGTGKTLAAEVLAHELELDLYKIDLSQVVSKYIGETERNLSEVFREAEATSAILFFDEADALFGKRSEVKDAHDRYANIEVAYLLQKMEEYEGVVILATNLRQNFDAAFLRRLQHIVEFPEPDEESRRRIWEVSFPARVPLGDDVDFSLLAREIELPGGSIKNMALAAAFAAAANGGIVHMPHLEHAARREFRKLGQAWAGTAVT